MKAHLQLRLRIEQVCDDYEAAWKKQQHGQRPDTATLISDWPAPARSQLLRELIALDLYHAPRTGLHLRQADYLPLFAATAAPPVWLGEMFSTDGEDGRAAAEGQGGSPEA